MAGEKQSVNQFPLLDSLVTQRGMKMIGIWHHTDLMQLFDVCKRTVQEWEANPEKGFPPRDLPGGAAHLCEDLEEFLRRSAERRPRRRKAAKPKQK